MSHDWLWQSLVMNMPVLCSGCFLRENSGRHQSSVEARDASEDEAYWDSMSNIISEKKLKFWDTAEKALQQYQ